MLRYQQGIILPFRGGLKPDWPFSVNRQSAQAEGLVGWWPMTVEGIIRDAALGSLLPGALKNGAVISFDPDFGPVFEITATGATQAGVIAATAGLDLSQELTIAAWVYDATSSQSHTINRDVESANKRLWIVRRDTDTSVNWHVWNSGGSLGQLAASNSWVMNQWFHIACTAKVSGSNIIQEVFFNGVSKGTNSFAGTAIKTDSTVPIQLGNSEDGTANSKIQKICDVRLYNYAIDAARAQAMYEAHSRWGLFYPLRSRVFISDAVAAPGGAQKTGIWAMNGF